MEKEALQINELSSRLGGQEILHGLSFTVREGDFLCLIGPNGAGKTTLLRSLNGLQPSSAGEVRLYGKPLAAYRRRALARLIAYVPQSHPAPIPFTVEELALQGRYPYLSPFSTISREDRTVAEKVLARVELSALAHRALENLSGGERQKAFIAAALAQQAPILILDEPTAYLDPHHQQEVYDLLSDLNRREKITIIAVTHDINLAALYSSRIIALQAGRILFDAPPEELMSPEKLKAVYGNDFMVIPHPELKIAMALPCRKKENS